MATKIGCDNFVYSLMVTEETASIGPSYGVPKGAPGVISININPNASQATLFADDGPMESASTLGNIEVEIQKNELTAQNKTDLLGHTLDSNGGVIYSSTDVSPYVAIGFRTLKSNGKYRYVWLYKGRFIDPEDNNETKGDSINFQSETISGQFVKLTSPLIVNNKVMHLWKYEIDGDTPDAEEAAMDSWFDAVAMPPSITPDIVATFSAGTVIGSTKAALPAAGAGNSFAYKIFTNVPTRPDVGDYIVGATSYTSGADIPGAVLDKYVAIYEITADKHAVKFLSHKLVENDINN